MLKCRIITRRYFPPGYDYEKEWKRALALLGIGVGLSLRFFRRLYHMIESLYNYTFDSSGLRKIKVLQKGALAEPFGRLVKGDYIFYIPFFLFLTIMAVRHYLYYYSTEKCIYLMRRLPQRCVLLKSCVQFPLFGMGAGAACLGVLYLLYYLLYLLAVPKGCLPL